MVLYNGFEVWTEGDSFLTAFHTPEDASAWCIAVQQVTCQLSMLVACSCRVPGCTIVPALDDPQCSCVTTISTAQLSCGCL